MNTNQKPQSKTTHGIIEEIQTTLPSNRLQAFDDTSLAFKLGIPARKLWFAIVANDYERNLATKGMYKVFKIKKKSGGYRVIHDPCVFLKRLQHIILKEVLDEVPVPDHVGAYVKGRGLEHTSSKHVGSSLIIHLDIVDFFNSTRKAWVRDMFQDIGYNETVSRLLASLVTAPIALTNGHKVGGVPQGACTSGAVCNLVANKRLDIPLLAYLKTRPEEWTYTRYADDLCVSTKDAVSDDTVRQMKMDLQDIISASGYRTNRRKTRHSRPTNPNKGMRVLGHSVHTHVNIPSPVYRRLRAIIHNCETQGAESQARRYGASCSEELLSRLSGEVGYWRHICPTKKVESLYQSLQRVTQREYGSDP